VDRITLLVPVGGIQALEDLVRLRIPAVVLISLAQVVAKLPNGFLHRLVAVFVGPLDIPQRDHLLHGLVSGNRIGLQGCRMPSVAPAFRRRHIFPAGNGTLRQRLLPGAGQNLTVHIVADRKPEQRQDGRRHVENRSPVEQFVFTDMRSGKNDDSEIAMLDRGTGGDIGNRPRPQVVGVETVIRHQNHREVFARLPPRFLKQRSQHAVVKLVCHGHHAVVEFEVRPPKPFSRQIPAGYATLATIRPPAHTGGLLRTFRRGSNTY